MIISLAVNLPPVSTIISFGKRNYFVSLHKLLTEANKMFTIALRYNKIGCHEYQTRRGQSRCLGNYLTASFVVCIFFGGKSEYNPTVSI